MPKKEIEAKLDTCLCLTLKVDIWTNVKMHDFLGLAGVIINDKGLKESFVIGMTRMQGKHNAENVKFAIESIINPFSFDKAKITAVVTDEGSNLLRLFKSLDQQSPLYLEENLPIALCPKGNNKTLTIKIISNILIVIFMIKSNRKRKSWSTWGHFLSKFGLSSSNE